METLQLHGRTFVKATKAARDLGYAPDYVGQLCRSGSIRAERVGRSWYVDAQEIAEHKKNKQRSIAAKSRASLVKRVSLVRRGEDGIGVMRALHPIEYAEDDAPLVPHIRTRSKDTSAAVESGNSDDDQRDEGVRHGATDVSTDRIPEVAKLDAAYTTPVFHRFDSVTQVDMRRRVTPEHELVESSPRKESHAASIDDDEKISRRERIAHQRQRPFGVGVLLVWMLAVTLTVGALFVRLDAVASEAGHVRSYRIEWILPDDVLLRIADMVSVYTGNSDESGVYSPNRAISSAG